ncbi:MAG TPA: GNAT family N-acetyltransferase [Pseudonocardiaceae bacterium]|jgi:CelD/BcsL family acetyltransferase involved in cellulose biosynthesis|nr:GNAT family N-acetyltransferase [Pseudonocardiaceae bacterium]
MRSDSDTVALAPMSSALAWNELVAANAGCFFHTHEWLATMADVLGMDFHPNTVLLDGRPVGVAPALVKRIGPFRTVNWLPFPYVGPLVPAALLPDVLALLAAWERRSLRSQHVLMSTLPDAFGYQEHRDRTFVVDLAGQTEDSLLRQVEPKRRAKIRRAATSGAVVRPATADEVRDLLPAWSSATFAAQALPAPYPTDGYATVWSRFGDSPDARFSTAVVDGEPVCVQASFAGAPRAVAWMMAGAGTRASSLALPLLYWDTIIWALGRGCAEFDLVGAPTDGVARYKRDWGAREEHYSVLRRQAVAHKAALRLRHALTST